MLPSEYQVLKETILQALLEHEYGISAERLIQKIAGRLASGESLRLGELRALVKGALLEFESERLIERVPGTNPVEFRPPVKGREGLIDAARRGHVAVLRRLLAEGAGQETKDAALISAVVNDRPEVVRLLLGAGANVDAKDSLFGRDALMYVTGRTSEEVVRMLETASNIGMQRTRK